MGLMDFYISSNAIREFVLGLCGLSNHIFEISLNSSLVTDELSNLGGDLQSYAIYSEKMNSISNFLGTSSKSMLAHSTRVMELSLEKTTCEEQIEKLKFGQELVSDGSNRDVIGESIQRLRNKIFPLDEEGAKVLSQLAQELKAFMNETKKLWLLSTNLKTQIEYDEVSYLSNINNKIEDSLSKADMTVQKLLAHLKELKQGQHDA